MSRVANIMSTTFVSVSPSACILEVAQQMKVTGTGIVLVCSSGKLRGVITEKDMVDVVAGGKDPSVMPASAVMSHYPLISPGTGIIEAAGLMVRRGVTALPVVQNGKPVGLLSLGKMQSESQVIAMMALGKVNREPNLTPAGV